MNYSSIIKRQTLPLLLFLAFACSAPGQQSATVALEPAVHGLLIVHATVSGHEGTFLFDSGSGVSSISPEFASTLGCRPWGQITGFRMTGERLDMQLCEHLTFGLVDRLFSPPAVGVFDVSKLLPAEVGHVDGTIALDLFANDAFTLSYSSHYLKLLDSKTISRQSSKTRMLVRVVRPAEGLALTVDIPVKTSAGTAWFELDSGNTSPFVIVNDSLAALFDLPSGAKQPRIKLSLGNGTSYEERARVLHLILDGNLGASFLATHDVTIDLPHAVAWIDQSNPEPSK